MIFVAADRKEIMVYGKEIYIRSSTRLDVQSSILELQLLVKVENLVWGSVCLVSAFGYLSIVLLVNGFLVLLSTSVGRACLLISPWFLHRCCF